MPGVRGESSLCHSAGSEPEPMRLFVKIRQNVSEPGITTANDAQFETRGRVPKHGRHRFARKASERVGQVNRRLLVWGNNRPSPALEVTLGSFLCLALRIHALVLCSDPRCELPSGVSLPVKAAPNPLLYQSCPVSLLRES
eukprot:138611-Rhodomonas_salina.1